MIGVSYTARFPATKCADCGQRINDDKAVVIEAEAQTPRGVTHVSVVLHRRCASDFGHDLEREALR